MVKVSSAQLWNCLLNELKANWNWLNFYLNVADANKTADWRETARTTVAALTESHKEYHAPLNGRP